MASQMFRSLTVAAALLALIFAMGCAGKEFAPKYNYWYYPSELVAADRAVEAAKKAGKDKECPEAFAEAEAMRDEAYRIYMACRDKEAIAKANEAAAKANALCPAKPEVKPEAKPEVKPSVKPETKPEAKPETKPETKPAVVDKKAILIEDVHFAFDKASLSKEAVAVLKKNIQVLKDNPAIKIRLEGHTCAHGAADYNMRLSERRAHAVKEYLIKAGIAADRLSTISYGKTRLAMPETPTPKNKESKEAKTNRRVHFEVVQ